MIVFMSKIENLFIVFVNEVYFFLVLVFIVFVYKFEWMDKLECCLNLMFDLDGGFILWFCFCLVLCIFCCSRFC